MPWMSIETSMMTMEDLQIGEAANENGHGCNPLAGLVGLFVDEATDDQHRDLQRRPVSMKRLAMLMRQDKPF